MLERKLTLMGKMCSILACAALLCLASCANPPQAEIDAAKTALDTASRSSDVVTYAPDALRAAQEKMTMLETEIAAQAKRSALSRNYDTAKSLALEAADLARRASEEAVTDKQQVAQDATALVDEVTAAIPVFESKVWAAKRVPRIKMDIITPLQLVPDQARAAVEDARKDIAAQAYATAKAKLMAVKDQLAEDGETITEQTRIARSH